MFATNECRLEVGPGERRGERLDQSRAVRHFFCRSPGVSGRLSAPPGVFVSGRVATPSHSLSPALAHGPLRRHRDLSLEPGMRGRSGDAPSLEWECVVVDNDSHDGTTELVEREIPWARIVRTGSN